MSSHRPEYARIRLALAASVYFRGLSTRALDALAGIGKIARGSDLDPLFTDAASCDMLWFVLEGGLVICWVNPHGKAIPVASIGPGSFYSNASLVRGAHATTECRAERGTVLAAFPRGKLLELAHDNREFADVMSRALLERIDAAIVYYADAVSAPLPERLARRLLGQALATRIDPAHVEVEVCVSQADLARILGASRSKLNAVLRGLERADVLRLGYRKIFLRDLDRLSEIAGGAAVPL